MVFYGESFTSGHQSHWLWLLVGDRSLSRRKYDTYLISSGSLFKDLRDFRDFFNTFILYSLYLFTNSVFGLLLIKQKFSAKYSYTVSFNC